jgi:hypothetical protein
VTSGWWGSLLLGAVVRVAVIAGVLLAVLCLWVWLTGRIKLRRRGPNGARTLDERIGAARLSQPFDRDAPYGRVDQLRTPELLEAAQRKSV